MPNEKLYYDLAWIWPIMSPPEDYVEEAEFFIELIEKHGQRVSGSVLDLGSGGGNIDFCLKKKFTIAGVDMSEAMLGLSQKLNPEVKYYRGDMRNVRLDMRFDIVMVHDAISYMLTENDLGNVFQTAFYHLKPGGIFITVVEETPEDFRQNKINSMVHSRDGTDVIFFENFYDPDRTDSTFEYTLIYLIRQNNKARIEIDNHICGIFPLNTWKRLLGQAGFEGIQEERFRSTEVNNESYRVLVGHKYR